MKQDAKAARTRKQADRLRPVAGRHNQRLKELRQAFRRAELTPQGECAVEGVKLLEEALRSGQNPESVFFSESARPSPKNFFPRSTLVRKRSFCRMHFSTRSCPATRPKAWQR